MNEKKACDTCGDELQATIIIYGHKHQGTYNVHCDTCGKPMRLCNGCFSDTDDCDDCWERRRTEQWCPMCDTPCVNLTPEEKKSHGHHCKAMPRKDR